MHEAAQRVVGGDAAGDIRRRLINWGAWCRDAPSYYYRAMSAEGMFRSPQPWEEAPPWGKFSVDQRDAQTLENAAQMLPLAKHALLRAHYVHRLAFGHCLRLAAKAAGEKRARTADFWDELTLAHAAILHCLTIPAAIRRDWARRYVRSLCVREVAAAID